MSIAFIDSFIAEAADNLLGIPTLNSIYKIECSMPRLIRDANKQATARVIMKELLNFVPSAAQRMNVRVIDVLRPIASHIRYKDAGVISLCFRETDVYDDLWFQYLFLISRVEFSKQMADFLNSHDMFVYDKTIYNPGDEINLLHPIFDPTRYNEEYE